VIYNKENIKNKKITILGAGISGFAAAKLGSYLGADIFISDKNEFNTKLLESINPKINYEVGLHSNKCLECDFMILSPGINPRNKEIFSFIAKGVNIVSEIEFSSWFTKQPIIAITGSNGKSTTVKILEKIISKKFNNVSLGGNIGIPFSQNVLLEIKNNLNQNIHILELSSFQLEYIQNFAPYISCILNLSEDHLDRYENAIEYFKAKMNIYKNLNKKSYFLYNQKNKKNFNLEKINATKICFGINKNKNNYYLENQIIKKCSNDNKILNYNKTKIQGLHNAENILAAVEISKLLNIEDEIIKKSIYDFNPLKHRMERIELNNNNERTFINDSKGTNIESTIFAINSSKMKTILILGGYSKGKNNYKKIHKSCNSIIHIICYGIEGKNIFKQIKNLFNCDYIENFNEAVLFAIKISNKNERILLSPACSSFDQFKNFEERGNKFKEIIKNYYLS